MEHSMEIANGFLSGLLSHLESIDAEREIYLQILCKHNLDPGSLQMIKLLNEVKRQAWIQMAKDELARGESAAAVLRKFSDFFIKLQP
jgi:hypothetical protein